MNSRWDGRSTHSKHWAELLDAWLPCPLQCCLLVTKYFCRHPIYKKQSSWLLYNGPITLWSVAISAIDPKLDPCCQLWYHNRSNKWPSFTSGNYGNTITAIVLSWLVMGYKEQLQKAKETTPSIRAIKIKQHMTYDNKPMTDESNC